MTLPVRPDSRHTRLEVASALLRSMVAALVIFPLIRFFLAAFALLPALILCLSSPSLAQDDVVNAAPRELRATDVPNDKGNALLVEWQAPADAGVQERMTGYALLRADADGGRSAAAAMSRWKLGDPFPPEGWEVRSEAPKAVTNFRDSSLRPKHSYWYAVATLVDGAPAGLTALSSPAAPQAQWFHRAKGFLLLNLLGISAVIVACVMMAARGHQFSIRKIAGLEAVEEAIGRSTEMGRPLLFVPGTQDMDNVQTVAGMTILGAVAQRTADYDAQLDVPVSKSLVLSTGREIVREAYTTAGRPDLYSDDVVHYVTDEQFGYVAAIDGFMVREKPAACFYMGAFFAESLILAETGNGIGAIQIAGTAQPTQLPFFVAACDYTLIGEELFAASAYLSKNPGLLGSLRGQDIGKAMVMLFILVGVTAETVGRLGSFGSPLLGVSAFLKQFFATNF